MDVPIWMQPAMPSIISGIALMVIGAIGGWALKAIRGIKEERKNMAEMREAFELFTHEHKVSMMATKNIIRALIIDMCNTALQQGYISDTSFKCLCELAESYHLMHGNSYADEIIEKVKTLYRHQGSYPSVLDAKTPIDIQHRKEF